HWASTTTCVPSLRALLADQTEAVRAAMRDDALASLRAQAGDGPVRLLATAIVAGGIQSA
ncbi:MAG TPA: hypothetical protein VHB98_06515, partial [Chloroflexota bacterium]|nr:hypothetical protein [Chloroflexota bacterium]